MKAVKLYEATGKDNSQLPQIARNLGISVPQLRGRLVHAGVYETDSVNRTQYTRALEIAYNMPEGTLKSLATKPSLKALRALTAAALKGA